MNYDCFFKGRHHCLTSRSKGLTISTECQTGMHVCICLHVCIALPRDSCCQVSLSSWTETLLTPLSALTEVPYIPSGSYHLIRTEKNGSERGFGYKRMPFLFTVLKTCQGFQHTGSIIRPEQDVSAGNVNLSSNQADIINTQQHLLPMGTGERWVCVFAADIREVRNKTHTKTAEIIIVCYFS